MNKMIRNLREQLDITLYGETKETSSKEVARGRSMLRALTGRGKVIPIKS